MSKLIFLIAFLILDASAASVEPQVETASENRIIGGVNSWIQTYPYQVSLELRGNHYCGGSIISDKYVLTAGHCVDNLAPRFVRVRAGTSWKLIGGSLYPAKKFIIHKEYAIRKDGVPINDIALIELSKSIVFDKFHMPIQLFDKNEKISRGANGVVTGWGSTGSPFYVGQLRSASVPIIPQALCKQAYSYRPGQLAPYLPDGQICAGFLGIGGKDACQGDSGGPLAVDGRLAGVVSWGEGCAHRDFPGVYSEVAYYRDWINKYSGV